MNDLISVVVPIYNVEQYLEECINSILSQTYRNIEVLLINDGSTDDSGLICDKYIFKDSRIRVYHKKNGGLSDARNYGIKKSNGKYIYLIDSDDYLILNETIELLYKNLKTYNADISIASYFEKHYNFESFFIDGDEVKNLEPEEALKAIYENSKYKYIFTVAHNKLYKKSLFDKDFYPLGKIHEDEYTTYKLYLKSKKIVFTNKNTYAYRIRNNSIMRSDYNLKRLDIFEAYEERIKIFKNLDYKELLKLTKERYFYNICYHRYMLYINNFIVEYKQLDSLYKKFLKDNNIFIFSLINIKFCLKILKFKLLKSGDT